MSSSSPTLSAASSSRSTQDREHPHGFCARLVQGVLIKAPALAYALLYMAYSVWHSWGSGARDRINHDAHFFGAIYGAMFTYAFEPERVVATVKHFI